MPTGGGWLKIHHQVAFEYPVLLIVGLAIRKIQLRGEKLGIFTLYFDMNVFGSASVHGRAVGHKSIAACRIRILVAAIPIALVVVSPVVVAMPNIDNCTRNRLAVGC